MVTIILGLTAAALALGLSILVFATGPRQRPNRLLALALLLEAAAQGGRVTYTMVAQLLGREWSLPFSYATWVAVGVLPFVYLMLVSVLESPLIRWVRSPRTRIVLVAAAVILGFLSLRAGILVRPPGGVSEVSLQFPRWVVLEQAMTYLLIVMVLLFALVVAIDAFRRTPRGSAAHQRARAFLMSFGIRDALGFIGLGLVLAGAVRGEPTIGPRAALVGLGEDVARLGTIAAIPLLAYGILRTQLFDIDMRIRLGIQRGTLVTFVALVLVVVFKVAEAWLSQTAGWVAGGIAAGVLLFAAPRLNRAADRVAQSAMPGATGSPEYLTFRKLEVYKAAVESTLETGVVDAREREMLRRLSIKLGLRPEDAAAIEAEVHAMWQGRGGLSPLAEAPRG